MAIEQNGILSQAVRRVLLTGGALAAGLSAHAASAQTQAPAPSTQGAVGLEEVVVTGSRIVAPNLAAVSPVTAITLEELKTTGTQRVEDMLNSLPQVVADQGSGLSMGSNGIATINLRGLGAQRTLVLVNGRRLQGGDPGGNFGANPQFASAADVNQIPAALLERVDVLSGGASSTYGADAVAGVVNFIMNDHFEGVRVDANIGIFNHSNHQDWMVPLLEKRNFAVPSGTNWDGADKDLTVIMGHAFADGAGSFEGYLGYRRNAGVTADHRDHAACVVDAGLDLSGVAGPYICGGSSNSAPAVFFGGDGSVNQFAPNGDVVGRYQRYNYAATHYLQRLDERYTAGFFGKLKFNEHAEAYTEFMFMDDKTQGAYAPAGAFLASGKAIDNLTGQPSGNMLVNCGPQVLVNGVYQPAPYGNPGMNPYLTQNAYNAICNFPAYNYTAAYQANGTPGPAFQIDPNGDAQLLIGRRNIEGGPRQDNYTHTSYRGVLGTKGAINADWNYDVSGVFSQTRANDFHNNDTSTSAMQAAMLAIPGPNGTPICRPPAAANCVPWNIWNPSIPVSADALKYISVPGIFEASSEEDIFNAFVSGDLTHQGVKTPWADDGLKLVLGTEYRRDRLSTYPDAELQQADLAGFGSPIPPVDATNHVWEAFTELRMPLVRNATGAKELDFEGGYRYSDYSAGFKTNTYKLGLVWAPISDVKLRGSFNRAARVPNLQELYQPQHAGLDTGTDLCTTGTFTAAQCAYTGLNPAIYGSPALVSPAGQYNGFIGGNPTLQPEVGKTTTFGFVITPTALPRFNMTVDYTDIKISNLIQSYGPNTIQQACLASGSATSSPCLLVHRNSSGSLWSSSLGYTYDPLQNEGELENKSFDVGLAYKFGMGKYGQLRARLDGSYLQKLEYTPAPLPGSVTAPPAAYDCAGKFGPSCTPVTPKWRHRLTLDWDTPTDGLSFGVTWRYFGSADNTLLDPNVPSDYAGSAYTANGLPPDARIPSISYLDLRASYAMDKITFRFGINNALDKDPPMFDTVNSGGNQIYAESNTFPSVYDTLGRYVFLNVTVDF